MPELGAISVMGLTLGRPPLRCTPLPALCAAILPPRNRLHAAQPLPALQQRHRLIPQQLTAGDLQLLLPPVPDQRLKVQHVAAIAQPGVSRAGRKPLPIPLSLLQPHRLSSAPLRRPTPLTGHVVRPALAAAREVLALGDQTLM